MSTSEQSGRAAATQGRKRAPATELPAHFETAANAKRERTRLAGRLRRSNEEGAAELADRLDSCTVGDRCGSGACPGCLRLLRMRWLAQGGRVLRGCANAYSVNLIPCECRVEAGRLDGFDFQRMVKREQRAIQRALTGRPWVVLGGIDVSMNTFANANPHWQIHLYCVVGAPDGVTGSEVREAFVRRGDDASARPLRVTAVAGGDLPKVLTYAVKARFARRSRYRDTSRANPTTNTRSQALTAAQSVELALALDRISMGDRLLLVGVRRTWPNGRLRLTRTHREGGK